MVPSGADLILGLMTGPRDGAFVGSPAKPVPRDVFVYFDNTDKLKAPHDAQALTRCLGDA